MMVAPRVIPSNTGRAGSSIIDRMVDHGAGPACQPAGGLRGDLRGSAQAPPPASPQPSGRPSEAQLRPLPHSELGSPERPPGAAHVQEEADRVSGLRSVCPVQIGTMRYGSRLPIAASMRREQVYPSTAQASGSCEFSPADNGSLAPVIRSWVRFRSTLDDPRLSRCVCRGTACAHPWLCGCVAVAIRRGRAHAARAVGARGGTGHRSSCGWRDRGPRRLGSDPRSDASRQVRPPS